VRSLDDSSIIGVKDIRFDCLKQSNTMLVNILRWIILKQGSVKEAI